MIIFGFPVTELEKYCLLLENARAHGVELRYRRDLLRIANFEFWRQRQNKLIW